MNMSFEQPQKMETYQDFMEKYDELLDRLSVLMNSRDLNPDDDSIIQEIESTKATLRDIEKQMREQSDNFLDTLDMDESETQLLDGEAKTDAMMEGFNKMAEEKLAHISNSSEKDRPMSDFSQERYTEIMTYVRRGLRRIISLRDKIFIDSATGLSDEQFDFYKREAGNIYRETDELVKDLSKDNIMMSEADEIGNKLEILADDLEHLSNSIVEESNTNY